MAPGPQQPTTFPWSGKIIPWSAALRSGPTKDARTLMDLPHGETVKVVLRSGGWLYIECRHESRKPLKGYVSRELIKHVQPTNTASRSVQQNAKAVTAQHLGPQLPRKQTPPPNPSVSFQLTQPKIIAIATDTYLKPTQFIVDPLLPGRHVLGFGQDLTFARGRKQPHGPGVGTTTAALDGKMRRLLKEFASSDTRGKARRLFDAFLKPQTSLYFWSDTGLTADAEAHPKPSSIERSPHRTRRSAPWGRRAFTRRSRRPAGTSTQPRPRRAWECRRSTTGTPSGTLLPQAGIRVLRRVRVG